VKILHLSDLHVTHDGRELNQLWGRARPAVAGQRFDFVVVSGDLTQRAAPSEYAKLKRFLEAEIEPLVIGDRAAVKSRVVIVPGNHDVDWNAEVFDTLALANARSDLAEQWFSDGQWRPATQPYRIKTGMFGHTSAFEIRAERYHERFVAVQSFLTDYYAGQLVYPHRPFALLDARGTGTGDWQAHVFPDLHVALLGFNSCYRNDRYWHGAQIHEDAITEARDHIDQLDHSRSFLRIGVWHHGLESHRNRPDRLTFENLTALVTSGIKVGFHGHVHKSHAQLHRFITDDFALVSTGTLGSASDDRPDAVANQFSIVDLHRNRLRVEVYESEGLGAYTAREDRRRFMYFDLDVERPHDASKPVRSWASHVLRRVTLDPESGVARIEVEIDDLDLSEPIVLARIATVFCSAPDLTATVDGQRLPVEQRQVGNRFEFRSDSWIAKRYRRLRWSYRIANAFALTRAEPSLIAKRDEYPHLADGSEVWSHQVQFDYDRLTLEFVLDAPDGDYFETTGGSGGVPAVTPIVERRIYGGRLPWERLSSEESRASKLLANTRRCAVSWPSPMANARYGLMFPLASAGEPVPRRFAVATSKLVQLCRSTRSRGDSLRSTLSTYLDASLKSSLEIGADVESFGEHAVAVGNLWNAVEQRLRPCFGFFPPDAWATQFDCGRGIAGHAFRFARPAAWHRSIAGEFDVIRVPTIPGTRDYEWILCLPILTRPDGGAIGVFGFAGTREHNTETTNQLAAFAQQIAQREPTADTSAFDRFWYVLNASFWLGLVDAAKTAVLDRGVIDMSEECSVAFLATSDSGDEH
jgi:3',5'-cyclic AMP phosphodiesterase CpdA